MQVKRETTAQQAFQKLAALCAKGEHCQQELREKMQRWGVPADEQAQVIERLLQGRYVDDERYTRAYVHDKVKYDRWGRRKVEQALWQKHIDEATIRDVLDEVSDTEWMEALRPLLQQKRRSLSAYNGYELNMRLTKYALQRGFAMNIIRQCLHVDDEETFPAD